MNSKILFEIKKTEITQGKITKITEYYSENFVYSEREGGKKFLFLKNENRYYIVDIDNKILINTSRNKFIDQLSKVKEILPEISIESEFVDGINSYRIDAKSNLAVLSGKIITKKIPNLENTAYLNSYLYHSLTSLISLKLKGNEIITELKTNLNIQGSNIETGTNVIDVKNITNNTNRFDYLCNFSHEKK